MKGCIAVILSNPISFFMLDESPASFIDNDGNCFIGKFDTDNNGFFDWLRVKSNKIIGVRWLIYDAEDTDLVIKHLPKHSNVQYDNDGSVFIYFDQEVDFDEDISCDQDFGENNFYVSEAGTYAISFSANSIGDIAEIGALNKDISTPRP